MIDFIFEYLENKGVQINSQEEYENITKGISLYLYENGIDTSEKREYFKRYVLKYLSLIEDNCLKHYFLMYSEISQVNQITIEYVSKGSVSSEKIDCLYNLMQRLYSCGLNDKYVPSAEVKYILGGLT